MDPFHPVAYKIAKHFGLGTYGERLAQEYLEEFLTDIFENNNPETCVDYLKDALANLHADEEG